MWKVAVHDFSSSLLKLFTTVKNNNLASCIVTVTYLFSKSQTDSQKIEKSFISRLINSYESHFFSFNLLFFFTKYKKSTPTASTAAIKNPSKSHSWTFFRFNISIRIEKDYTSCFHFCCKWSHFFLCLNVSYDV